MSHSNTWSAWNADTKYPCNNGFEAGASPPCEVVWENWEHTLTGCILLQGKNTTTTDRDEAPAVFQFITGHARKKDEICGRLVGLAAWESFLHQLEHDDFSALPLADVKSRFNIYCDALCQINARKEALADAGHEAMCKDLLAVEQFEKSLSS